MLDNTELIETLEETKTKAAEITEKLRQGAQTTIEIDKIRNGYRPAARRGAVLFFVLLDMSLVNNMYQFSLNSYLDVFEASLKRSLPDSILQKRLNNIIDTLTFNVYNYACTGLFERHKLLFSFQMCIKLQQDSGLVPQPQLDFLKGYIALEKVKKQNPCPNWIFDQPWQDIVKKKKSPLVYSTQLLLEVNG